MSVTDSSATRQLLDAAANGDEDAVDLLIARHRRYVRQLIELRLGPDIQARVDSSDVIQETLIVASRRFYEFLEQRPISFRLWLRGKALDRLVEARRRHTARKRDARRDIPITDASSMLIAQKLIPMVPRNPLVQQELAAKVRLSLQRLTEQQQEILLLRHAECLSNAEAAEVLGIDPGNASKRYGRALGRLSTELRKLGVTSL